MALYLNSSLDEIESEQSIKLENFANKIDAKDFVIGLANDRFANCLNSQRLNCCHHVLLFSFDSQREQHYKGTFCHVIIYCF